MKIFLGFVGGILLNHGLLPTLGFWNGVFVTCGVMCIAMAMSWAMCEVKR